MIELDANIGKGGLQIMDGMALRYAREMERLGQDVEQCRTGVCRVDSPTARSFLVDAGRTAAGDDGLVCTPGRRDTGEATQAIGKGGLAGGTAPTLPPWTFATQAGIVHLDVTGQRLAVIVLFHRLHPLVFQTPRGVVGDPQLPLQLQDRGPILQLRQDIYPQEPGCQW